MIWDKLASNEYQTKLFLLKLFKNAFFMVSYTFLSRILFNLISTKIFRSSITFNWAIFDFFNKQ